ncbi:hypothetical protein EYR38_007090 [Pleurotus pulmonarius]|nr:hypothetical protein EYR38_007090 [Pleurotus pulmonarius]
MFTDKPGKNTLSIRLAESAVFLRTNDFTGRSRDSRPALLRGLLVLDLVKPTKISSIELELTAKTSTSWPEGIGARRLEVTEDHTVFAATTIFFKAGPTPRRTASIGPGTHDEAVRDDWDDEPQHMTLPRRTDERRGRTDTSDRASRRISLDSSVFQRYPVSHHEDHRLTQTPPYSPQSASPLVSPLMSPMERSASTLYSPHTSLRQDESPAQTLEDLRNALFDHNRHSSLSLNGGLFPRRDGSRSLSRRPSIEDIPEYEPGPSNHTSTNSHMGVSSPRSLSRHDHSFPNGTSSPRSVSRDPVSPDDDSKHDHRGRKHHRFSLASVSSAIRDAVRPASPRKPESREREGDHRRGRSLDKGKAKAVSKERTTLVNSGSDSIKSDKERKDAWKEFKKGTYTYPISFQIPGHSPPTLQCNFGSVVWQLKATVHRPGAFKSKLVTSREVNVICSPGSDDTEDTENIIVERQWEDQLQYFISISGRSFYIGGTVPVQFTLMPLAKVRIYRIGVYIEERVDYYTNMKRIARTDPINRTLLLSLKHEGKGGGHILPLDSDDVEAYHKSPLSTVLTRNEDPSEMASNFMGPGPWTFHHDLQLPTSCNILHFTNKNRRGNIVITHMLKCVIRIERGDDKHLDPKTGKRKLFDIVIQTPVQILSCRCNPDWISLPPYSESSEDWIHDQQQCPCVARKNSANNLLSRINTRRSSDSSVSSIASSFVEAMSSPTPRRYETLLDQNTLFERLVAGQESEAGEVPPSYDAVTRERGGVNGH